MTLLQVLVLHGNQFAPTLFDIRILIGSICIPWCSPLFVDFFFTKNGWFILLNDSGFLVDLFMVFGCFWDGVPYEQLLKNHQIENSINFAHKKSARFLVYLKKPHGFQGGCARPYQCWSLWAAWRWWGHNCCILRLIQITKKISWKKLSLFVYYCICF